MFEKILNKVKIKKEIKKNGLYIDIQTTKLRNNVEFVLYNLPKQMVKGIEIIEEIYDVEHEPHQIIVKQTMNAMDIKRQIGLFVFREKRWDKQEEFTKKLLAEEKIDLKLFYEIYDTRDYLTVYEFVNADVFAVAYGNDFMALDEISHAVNSLYIKTFTEINFSKQHSLDNLVESLFNQQEEKDDDLPFFK